MNGFHTRSALVRHAERGLGIRSRPYAAREIVFAINPIPQPTPHGRKDKWLGHATLAMIAVYVLAFFIVAVLMAAQNLPGA